MTYRDRRSKVTTPPGRHPGVTEDRGGPGRSLKVLEPSPDTHRVPLPVVERTSSGHSYCDLQTSTTLSLGSRSRRSTKILQEGQRRTRISGSEVPVEGKRCRSRRLKSSSVSPFSGSVWLLTVGTRDYWL